MPFPNPQGLLLMPEYMSDVPKDDVAHMTSLGLDSNIDTFVPDGMFYYSRGLIGYTNIFQPILVLLHGYPQTNFMWRHIIPLLPKEIPLFIPDLCGYGRSLPIQTGSKQYANQLVCEKIIDTLFSIIANVNFRDPEVPIIIAGHDRGARNCHRLAVNTTHSQSRKRLNIIGSMFLDIVPTSVQFQSFGTPSSSVRTFHWPFLANAGLAFDMIKAYGGAKWTRMCIERWAGDDEECLTRLRSNNALEVYGRFFEKDSVLHASCNDYRAGADEDVQLQVENQEKNQKLNIDVLVLYSADYLGKRYDVKRVWEEWMGNGNLEVQEIAGVGHFIAEEKPEETATAMVKFYRKF